MSMALRSRSVAQLATSNKAVQLSERKAAAVIAAAVQT